MRGMSIVLMYLIIVFAAGTLHTAPTPDAPFPEVQVMGVAHDADGSFSVLLAAKSPPPSMASPLLAMVIGVGQTEGASIAMALGQARFVRPMTHDLAVELIGKMDVSLESLTIHTLRHGTYFARLEFRNGKKTFSMDCRPSDGIAMAVRAHAAIRVNPRLLRDLSLPNGKDDRAAVAANVSRQVNVEEEEPADVTGL